MRTIFVKPTKDGGADEIVSHLYDYLNGLVVDLEEEGLPIGTCHEATVTALIDVCAVSIGKVKASALINRLTAKMLVDPELPV